MKNFNKIILTIAISLLALSCGKKEAVTNSKISLFSGISAITGQFPGGVVLFARNTETGYVLTKSITTSDEEVQFENGEYEFLIMAWSGAESMTGTTSCAEKGDVTLDGGEVTLNFSLQSGDCNTLSKKSGALFFHSTPMGGNIPAIDGDYSVRLSLPQFSGVPSISSTELPSGFIGSTCLAKDSVDDSLNLDSSSSFPAIDLPIVAQVFDGNSTCTGLPTRMYILPTGLDEDNTPYTVNSVNIPLNDLVFSVNVSNGDTFTLPFVDGAYSYNAYVDWGDGVSSTATTWDAEGATHIFTATGEYIIRVSGTAEALNCDGISACAQITHVLNLGDLGYTNMSTAFLAASNLKSLSGGNTTNVTSMFAMFRNAASLINIDLSAFNTSNVTNMGSMFNGASSLASLDLSGFDTSKVTYMSWMFRGATSLASLDLSGFDTSKVTHMDYMFNTSSLTSLDVAGFNTSNVIHMNNMFKEASSLTSLDLSGFNTSSVINMNNMFFGASGLTNLDVTSFNTSSVTNMNNMFFGASGLTNLDVTSFNTSSVTYMYNMFFGASGLTNLDVTSFDTSSVTNMSGMFSGASGLTTLNISGINTSSVTNMSSMFQGLSNLVSLDLSGLDTSSVINMDSMFEGMSSLTSLDVSGLNTSSATSMFHMFYDMSGITSLDLSNFDTSSVTNMNSMFYGTTSLTALDLTGFDTSSVTNMMSMFKNASSLATLDLSTFDTSSANYMDYMFYNTPALSSLNATGWDISSISTYTDIFSGVNVSFSLVCNNQDFVPDGSGPGATGKLFGETCN